MRRSDIRALAQLVTEATLGLTRITEGVHQSVLGTTGVTGGEHPTQTAGLTGLVYRTIRGITSVVGRGVDATMAGVDSLLVSPPEPAHETSERAAVVAALNGVLGDHLVERDNAFATPMTLRYRGQVLHDATQHPVEGATGKLALMVHGLCMNDLQWRTTRDGRAVDHGATLAAHGYSPIYLRYNTGLHISQNGRAMATLMAQLAQGWPTPVEEIAVVAHSMGGLVTRGAIHVAEQEGHDWLSLLRRVVFLGTPHHGAPLEQVGNWVGTLLGRSIYTAPFTVLPRLRSAGITDLRHGHVIDEDWQGRDRFAPGSDMRPIVPLPETIAFYTIGATTRAKRGAWADRVMGDGLVPLNSALGHHRDPGRRLAFQADSQWVAHRTSHLGLLSDLAVSRQIVRWLAPDTDSAT